MTSKQPRISLKPLAVSDLPAALDLQAKAYPAFLVEDETVFASRILLPDSYCLAAFLDEVLAGYVLAHGWLGKSPPPLGALLSASSAIKSEVLYIHDLCVDPAVRGLDIGGRLVRQVIRAAQDDGLRSAELIAVDGAASYWRRNGFVAAQASPDLGIKLASYGADAQWMTLAFERE